MPARPPAGSERGAAAPEVRDEPAAGAVDPLAAALSGTHEPVPSEEQLEQRFGELSAPQLEGAEKAIAWMLHQECQAVIARKFESGDYLVEVVPVGTPLSQASIHPDGTPRPTETRYEPLDDELLEARTAEVHQREVPTMPARLAELSWIRRRLAATRSKGPSAADRDR